MSGAEVGDGDHESPTATEHALRGRLLLVAQPQPISSSSSSASAAMAAAADPTGCLFTLMSLLDVVPGLRELMMKTSESVDEDDGCDSMLEVRLSAFMNGAVSCGFEPASVREMASTMLVSVKGHMVGPVANLTDVSQSSSVP